jgi:FkbM family methyltransferase
MTTTTLTMVDDVRVVVPDALNLITPYVLLEQQDWFEDEIKFLRRLLQPGQKIIDIGANYGVYTLSMAKTVGPTGRVWAFEPASTTARLLAESIQANGFSQVVLEQSALSSAPGTAQLSLNDNSELNALVHGAQPTSQSEAVPLTTLDACLEKFGWQDIEFMKIDAEGEEANILLGGKQFFAELSPLVEYEIKAGADLHLDLVQNFAALGYDSYRLVPGLDLLVPFDAESPADGYLLNLFGCKPDRAAKLAERGFLLDSTSSPSTAGVALSAEIKSNSKYGWRHTIAKTPYGVQLANVWEPMVAAGNSAELLEALSLYAISQDADLSSRQRFQALETSLNLLKALCERDASHLRLASLARVAQEYGARSLAVNALNQLCNTLFQQMQVDPREPFLAPGERFDSIPPRAAIGDWVIAAALEELERIGSFSSFYTGTAAQQRLEIIRDIGFGSAEMARRLQLLQRRFSLSTAAT